jgi:hypothetical protein
LNVEAPRAVSAQVTASVGKTTVPVSATREGRKWAIAFAEPLLLQSQETLMVKLEW